MTCKYCQDSGAVDKDGNMSPDNKFKLLACPVCKKDGTKTNLDIDVNKELKDFSRAKKSWAVELNPEQWDSDKVQAFEKFVKYNLVSEKGWDPVSNEGLTSEGWYRLKFHQTLWLSMVQRVMRFAPKNSYVLKFTEDK